MGEATEEDATHMQRIVFISQVPRLTHIQHSMTCAIIRQEMPRNIVFVVVLATHTHIARVLVKCIDEGRLPGSALRRLGRLKFWSQGFLVANLYACNIFP